uniref:Uncharacterized protein n=1 Tax=Rhizophora mucronata TaxID=61149 RepID=A0A2P2QSD7_RHIMU
MLSGILDENESEILVSFTVHYSTLEKC